MNVKELREKLEDFNDNLEILWNDGEIEIIAIQQKALSVEEISGDETEQEFLCFDLMVIK